MTETIINAFNLPDAMTNLVKAGHTLVALVLVIILGAATAGPAQAESTDVFTVVTSGDSETQMMAMVLSNQMLNRGVTVRVLLCSEGGRLGVEGELFPVFDPAERTPQQLLQRLIAEGATVEVCAIFLPNSGYDEGNLLEGIGVAAPGDVADYMLGEGVRYFTF